MTPAGELRAAADVLDERTLRISSGEDGDVKVEVGTGPLVTWLRHEAKRWDNHCSETPDYVTALAFARAVAKAANR